MVFSLLCMIQIMEFLLLSLWDLCGHTFSHSLSGNTYPYPKEAQSWESVYD